MKKALLVVLWLLAVAGPHVRAAEWQWSAAARGAVSAETGRAPEGYLWIPPTARRVRAVVVGQHNMSEECLFENPLFRERMAALGFALLWITPMLDMPWDETTGCREALDGMLADLAAASGYDELATAPVVAVGHSALATFPWNFAAWNPERTLAVVSLHGDAPCTDLTGYGRANLAWGSERNIDGIPGLLVVGEYEWWEARVQPALAFRKRYPASCISFLGDAGRGHFDVGDSTAVYIARFLEKAAEQRLGTPLRRVDPADGWLAERWHPAQQRRTEPAPAACYAGDPSEAFWYFDEEMARRTEARYAATRGKRPLAIGFEQRNAAIPYDEALHARLRCEPVTDGDGVTFYLKAFLSDSLRQRPAAERPAGEPRVRRIAGPVEVVGDTMFRIRFDRGTARNPRRGTEIWLAAEHPGDEVFKSAVQQILVRIPFRNRAGRPQRIRFAALPDVKRGGELPQLAAASDCGLPVAYYVRQGPVRIEDGKLVLTAIPQRTRFPIRVTVGAVQYGIAGEVQTAEPVERTFYITE